MQGCEWEKKVEQNYSDVSAFAIVFLRAKYVGDSRVSMFELKWTNKWNL